MPKFATPQSRAHKGHKRGTRQSCAGHPPYPPPKNFFANRVRHATYRDRNPLAPSGLGIM